MARFLRGGSVVVTESAVEGGDGIEGGASDEEWKAAFYRNGILVPSTDEIPDVHPSLTVDNFERSFLKAENEFTTKSAKTIPLKTVKILLGALEIIRAPLDMAYGLYKHVSKAFNANAEIVRGTYRISIGGDTYTFSAPTGSSYFGVPSSFARASAAASAGPRSTASVPLASDLPSVPRTRSGEEDEQTVGVDSNEDGGGPSLASRLVGAAGTVGSSLGSAAASAFSSISGFFSSSPQVNPTTMPVTAVFPPPLPPSSTSSSSAPSGASSSRAAVLSPVFSAPSPTAPPFVAPASTAPSIPATTASRNGGVVLDDATVTAIATKIAEVRRAQDKRAANSGIKRHIPTAGDAIVGTGVEEGMDKEKCPVGWETCGALATQAGACDPTDKRQIGQLSIARQELMPNGDIGTALCVPSKFAEDLPDKVSAKIMKIILQKLGMNVNLEGDDDVYV